MKILVVAATSYEIAPLIQHMDQHAEKESFFEYKYKGQIVYPLVTGVGALMTAFAMARYNDIKNVKVAINAGVAGSYKPHLEKGTVVEVVRDRFADLGVEEADGSFTDVFRLGLNDKDRYPYQSGWIVNNKIKYRSGLQKVNGLTVNKVHGSADSISKVKALYPADVETMEGAGFMYASRVMDMSHHQLRAISNMVEPRNKDNWEISLAIDNLNAELITFIDKIIEAETT